MRTYKIGIRTKDLRIKVAIFHEFYQSLDPESNKLSEQIEEKQKIMDETWLKELNQRNLELEGEDSSKWDCATVSVSSSVLNKLSQVEQGKFEITEFKRATNEIEHWARVEEICDFFGVEEPDLAGDVYVRKFKNLTVDEESRWMDLKDINDEMPEGFGVKIDRS